MVKVAIAAANSGLARELIDELTRDQKHHVIGLARKDPSTFPKIPGVQWVQTTYQDKDELVQLFRGVEVVLSFILAHNDPGNASANSLLDAAIEAGVKRFVPSEWAMNQSLPSIIDSVPWYQGKVDMRERLRRINKDNKVIEYTLFQPGMFMEYAGYPRSTTTHVLVLPMPWSIDPGRVVIIDGHQDDVTTMTTVGDIARVVRRAIEYEGEWPEVGGIAGQYITARQFKETVEKVTGKTVELATIKEDAKSGKLTLDMPSVDHPSIPEDQRAVWHAPAWTGLLAALSHGAWTTTDEWNRLLPDYEFTTFEQYVRSNWGCEEQGKKVHSN